MEDINEKLLRSNTGRVDQLFARYIFSSSHLVSVHILNTVSVM